MLDTPEGGGGAYLMIPSIILLSPLIRYFVLNSVNALQKYLEVKL